MITPEEILREKFETVLIANYDLDGTDVFTN